jgi:hypothetical protein
MLMERVLRGLGLSYVSMDSMNPMLNDWTSLSYLLMEKQSKILPSGSSSSKITTVGSSRHQLQMTQTCGKFCPTQNRPIIRKMPRMKTS